MVEERVKRLVVEVKDTHIKEGVKCACMSCPIALAIIDATKAKAHEVFVGGSYVDLYGRHRQLPDAARQFIADFDCGMPVIPFSFELELPCPKPLHPKTLSMPT